MNNTMGKLLLILPQKTNECELTEINFIPEDTDFIQDHTMFEDRRKQLVNEYEEELRNFRNNSMLMI